MTYADMHLVDASDISKYRTVRDFRVRKHKSGLLPAFLESENTTAVSVAAEVVVYENEAIMTKVSIKRADMIITH